MASTPVNGTGGALPLAVNKALRPTPTSGHSTPRVLPQEGPGGSGYVAPVFEGKEKQMEAVMDGVEEKGFIPPDFVESETRWFYNELGIDDMYFSTESVEA
jgi:glutamate dehydrogenase